MFTSYFNDILSHQKLDDKDRAEINDTFDYFQRFLQSHPEHPIVRKAGTQAKDIAVHAQFDLDLQVVFPNNHQWSIGQIYEQILMYLKKDPDIKVRQKVVAIEATWNGFPVDIVPAKQIDEIFVNVWESAYNRPKRTSIDRQIEIITSFRRRDVFKIVKLWKIAHKLLGPSFLYEVYTIRALDLLNPDEIAGGDLSDLMFHVWDYFTKTALNIKLVDPTNDNNIISELWDEQDRQKIAQYANYALQGYDDGDITPIFFGKFH